MDFLQSESGLPDGIHIFIPKGRLWYILEGLGMEKFFCIYGQFGILYDHFVFLWPFG
jgi:hypothetical protein